MARNAAILEAALREPGVEDPAHYRRRVTWLALVHPCLFLCSIAGIVLLIWRGEFFVTLSQRSNVETLTIAFFLVFFAYFSVATAPGAIGALRIAWYRMRLRVGDRERVEAARERALGQRGDGSSAAFDKAIELAGAPGKPWELEVRDATGSLGRLRFDGVRVMHLDTFRGGSNTLLGYVETMLTKHGGQRVSIVHWGSTAEEEQLQYVAISEGLRALGHKLEVAAWPTVVLGDDARQILEHEVGELCSALREEAFLPDWEFEGEHKLPIIPEPLGIISLSRSEKRVDPLSSLTAALVIIAIVVGVICFFLARPPWIPGK
jgi:hypothetical protein